jgi:hypothetical protein
LTAQKQEMRQKPSHYFLNLLSEKVKFIRETQISKAQCIEICKLNNPAEGGGFHTRDSRIYPCVEWKWEKGSYNKLVVRNLKNDTP